MNTVKDNILVIQKLYEAAGKGDLQTAFGLYSPDIEWELVAGKQIPWSGKKSGHKGVADFFTQIASVAQPKEFGIDRIVAQDDAVVVFGKEVYEVKSTGKKWSTNWVHTYYLRDGKVCKFVEYCDTAAIANALA